MLETGKVIKIEGDKTIINLSTGKHCDKCRICIVGNGGQRTLIVGNNIGAKIGDRVEVFIPDGMISKSSFSVFILPIMAFLVGYFFAWFFSRSETLSVVAGAITFVLTFYALFIYEKKLSQFKKDTLPYILRVLEHGKNKEK